LLSQQTDTRSFFWAKIGPTATPAQPENDPGEEPIGYSHSSDALLAELGGNSMPPSAVQQSSKRDRSDPVPIAGVVVKINSKEVVSND
jgi:hypothetical protein